MMCQLPVMTRALGSKACLVTSRRCKRFSRNALIDSSTSSCVPKGARGMPRSDPCPNIFIAGAGRGATGEGEDPS
eukprot:9494141-Pyramimonas_sp.AAC.1